MRKMIWGEKKIIGVLFSLAFAMIAITLFTSIKTYADEPSIIQENISGYYGNYKLNGDTTLGNNGMPFIANVNGNTTFDLNGYTLTLNGTLTVNEYTSFTLTNSQESGGKLIGNGYINLRPDSSVIIEKGVAAEISIWTNTGYNNNLIINDGGQLIIPSEKDLRVGSSSGVTNHGTITVESGGSIGNNGTITNDGTITNNGTITNDGTITNNGTITNITNGGTIDGSGTVTGNPVTSVTRRQYTVRFDTNGGTDGPASMSQESTTGSAEFTIPATVPTREHYIFHGWADSQNATAAQYKPGNTATVTEEEHTLYAVWEKKKAPRIDIEAVDDKTYGDEAFDLKVDTDSNGTMTFASDHPEVVLVDQNGQASIRGVGTANITVKVAETDTHLEGTGTVRINVDQSNGFINISVANYEKGLSDTAFSVAPEKGGTSHGKVTYLSSNEQVAKVDQNGTVHIVGEGTAVITLKIPESDTHKEVIETITINVKAYTVTFNSNGAGGENLTQKVNKEGALDSLPSVTREGYEFDGWYTEENGGERITTNTVFTGDTTVYAHWTKIETPEPSEPERPEKPSRPVRPYRPSGSSSSTSSSLSNRTANTNTTQNQTKNNSDVIPFTDVAKSSYYYDAVQWAVKKGITSGTSKTAFSPSDPCRRSQMVTFLWRMAGSPDVKGELPLTDVNKNSFYYKALLWAYQNGIASGISKTAFGPNDNCTRGQMAVFLQRMSKEKYEAKNHGFSDVKDNAYYASAVAWLKKSGITAGTSDTTFSPSDSCSRGQMVTFLYRYSQKRE